jgi:hypothetical protein
MFATPVHCIVMPHLEQLLERIAIALEKIADIRPEVNTNETPFPWSEATIKIRPWKVRGGYHISDEDEKRFSVRPETCEGLIRVGRSRLCDGLLHLVGKGSVEKLDPLMERLGFGDRWMSS